MKDYKRYYIIPAEPSLVYKALTQENTIRLWTGDQVHMEEKAGTEFSLWDGSIVGKNLSFDNDKLIEQEWYFGDSSPNAPSIVKLKLHPHPQGTSLELRHSNIPDEAYDDIVEGWNEVYMASLIDFYSGK